MITIKISASQGEGKTRAARAVGVAMMTDAKLGEMECIIVDEDMPLSDKAIKNFEKSGIKILIYTEP